MIYLNMRSLCDPSEPVGMGILLVKNKAPHGAVNVDSVQQFSSIPALNTKFRSTRDTKFTCLKVSEGTLI